MSAATRIRLLSISGLVAGVAAATVTGWGDVTWWAPIVLALAVVSAETAVVHLSFGRRRWTFSLTEGAIAAALVYRPGAWSLVAVVAGVFAAQLLRHQERLKV